MTEAGDDALVARVRERDQAAFRRLVCRHLDSVHRYLARLTGSPADADDLAQETFLRLWQRADSYRPGRVKLSTWLHTIAHHLAVDAHRRHRSGQRQPVHAASESPAADPADEPEASALAHQTERRLHAALSALPANQRAALLLCQVQGFSNQEAAAILGVGVRALESLIARARATLRREMLAGPAQPHRRQSSTS